MHKYISVHSFGNDFLKKLAGTLEQAYGLVCFSKAVVRAVWLVQNNNHHFYLGMDPRVNQCVEDVGEGIRAHSVGLG